MIGGKIPEQIHLCPLLDRILQFSPLRFFHHFRIIQQIKHSPHLSGCERKRVKGLVDILKMRRRLEHGSQMVAVDDDNFRIRIIQRILQHPVTGGQRIGMSTEIIGCDSVFLP